MVSFLLKEILGVMKLNEGFGLYKSKVVHSTICKNGEVCMYVKEKEEIPSLPSIAVCKS